MEVDTKTVIKTDVSDYYDHAKEMKEFDETKAGVKGLVDSGVTKIPPFFIHAAEELPKEAEGSTGIRLKIPIIDLEGIHDSPERRKSIVEEVRRASETWGFFQMVNHGIPVRILDEMIEGIKLFHEQPVDMKKEIYSRDPKQKARFYTSGEFRPATWKDSLTCSFYEDHPESYDYLPVICRKIMVEYINNIKKLTETLSKLLSEALGLSPDFLRHIKCMKAQNLVAHYAPSCPEPELTLGTVKHTDALFLTILLQENIGGLQLVHGNQWVDIPPIHGSLSANIGDLLQLITNDKFKSVEHRVLAKKIGPRVSVATFAVPSPSIISGKTDVWEPIKELLAANNPPLYRGTSVMEYMGVYRSQGQNGNSSLPYFSLRADEDKQQ